MLVQLQSILKPDKAVCEISDLYYHRRENRIDFNGYFNLFYIKKRKKYTTITNLDISIQLKGYKELIIVHNHKDLEKKKLISSELRDYCFSFPLDDFDDGVFWFALIEDESIEDRELQGIYETKQSTSTFNRVNIAVNICTFKRETYVARNLKQMQNSLLQNKKLEVSDHLKIYIIDNGRTLHDHSDIQELVKGSKGNIKIYKNKNAGGVGGFTRGMLEIIDDKNDLGLTHVLLMDDDAVIEPDSLVRLYGVLVTIRKEWKEAAIGGGVFREDYPEILFTAGEMWKDGRVIKPEFLLDMRNYENCTCSYIQDGTNEYNYYSGWWCSCYPLTTVTESNLPLPLFIHSDDIEYGIRNNAKSIIYLNGIDVWHRGFELTMPGSNLYYDVRNNLILIALYCGEKAEKIALQHVIKRLVGALLRMKYQECRVIYQALVDFMKGPDWLVGKNPEELLKEVMSYSCKLYKFEDLHMHLTKNECEIISDQILSYCSKFNIDEVRRHYKISEQIPKLKSLSFNGWIFPADRDIISAISVLESPYATYRKRKIVIFEPYTKRFMIAKKSYRSLCKGLQYNLKAYFLIRKNFHFVQNQYKSKQKWLMSAEMWRIYLGLHNHIHG